LRFTGLRKVDADSKTARIVVSESANRAPEGGTSVVPGTQKAKERGEHRLSLKIEVGQTTR